MNFKTKSSYLNEKIQTSSFLNPAKITPINQENTGEYRVLLQTGNESLYNVNLMLKKSGNTTICLEAGWDKKEVEVYKWDEKEEKDVIDYKYNYTVPLTLSFYKTKELIKQASLNKVKDNEISITSPSNPNKFCYEADPNHDFYLKFGDNSVIVVQNSRIISDSILTNVTAETNFTHLNISNTAPYDSLEAYWSFDGDIHDTAKFTAYDFTENNYDGTGIENAVVNETDCIFDDCLHTALQPDGVGTGFNGTEFDELTISVWVYARVFGDTLYVVDNSPATGGGYILRADTTGDMYFYVYSGGAHGGISGANVLTTNEWHYVIAIHNTTANCIRVWNTTASLGGMACTSYDASTGIDDSADLMDIGIEVEHTKEWKGLIDELMIFSTDLTEAQALEIYNNQSARFLPTGKQELINQTYLNITSGNNIVNVTTTLENNLGSNISLQVGYFDGSWSYTASQNITSGLNHTFTISSSSTNISLNYTFYAGTSQFYTPIIKDDITIEYYAVGVDDEYPIFSAFWDNNGSLIDEGLGKFNATVTHTNGTVFLEINNTNTTAHNLSATMYNISYSFTHAGNYNYRWCGYGNGSSENFNCSGIKVYTVNSSVADSCTAPTSGNWIVQCSDYCNWSTNQIIPANITFNATGIVRILANFSFNSTNQYAIVRSGCKIISKSGGGFNG